MTFEEYDDFVAEIAFYPRDRGLTYCALKLNGEAGEVADKIGKMIRDDDAIMTDERRDALILELGDVMWYLSALAMELDCSLEYIARRNQEKLLTRVSKGTLKGDGDNR